MRITLGSIFGSSYAHIWSISVRKSMSAFTTTNNTGLIPNMRPDSMEIPILRKSDGGTSHSSLTPRSCCVDIGAMVS
jgi:hypothetical protein